MHMRSFTHKGSVFVVVFFTASLVLGYALWKNHGASLVSWPPAAPAFALSLQSDKESYAHDELVELSLRPSGDAAREILRKSTVPFTAWVEREGQLVRTVGELEKMRLAYDPKEKVWRARWPIPWNAREGDYVLRLATAALPSGLGTLQAGSFQVVSRAFDPVPAGVWCSSPGRARVFATVYGAERGGAFRRGHGRMGRFHGGGRGSRSGGGVQRTF
ncbi:MAG: hypothetical protein IPN90_10830 [Elusimicrobia bacterium]|nr:hypothetical protein [Elusimicrobiota bacterium]